MNIQEWRVQRVNFETFKRKKNVRSLAESFSICIYDPIAMETILLNHIYKYKALKSDIRILYYMNYLCEISTILTN